MQKIVVYLDTQDLIRLHNARQGTSDYDLREKLLWYVSNQVAAFPFSFISFFEFLTDFQKEFETDRRERAALLRSLSAGHSLPHFLQLDRLEHYSYFDGWLPSGVTSSLNVAFIEDEVLDTLRKKLPLNRDMRRRLANKVVFRKILKQKPDLFTIDVADAVRIGLPPDFVEKHVLRNYMLGEISVEDANTELRRTLLDPVQVFELWFVKHAKTNPLNNEMKSSIDSFMRLAENFRSAIADLSSRKARLDAERARVVKLVRAENQNAVARGERIPFDLKSIPSVRTPREMLSDFDFLRLAETFSLSVSKVFKEYAISVANGQAVQRSDVCDVLHSSYVGMCDLWRGDRKFCRVVARAMPELESRIVDRLEDLPAKIDDLRKQCL